MQRRNERFLSVSSDCHLLLQDFGFTSAPKEESPSEHKHSSAFPLWLHLTKSINVTLQAPGVKLQLLLLRNSYGEVGSAGALCHVGFICMVLCKGSM